MVLRLNVSSNPARKYWIPKEISASLGSMIHLSKVGTQKKKKKSLLKF